MISFHKLGIVIVMRRRYQWAFTRGKICYIVGENGRPVNMKGVGRKGTEFLLQDVGKIDILLKKASEVFRSLDDAVKNEIG